MDTILTVLFFLFYFGAAFFISNFVTSASLCIIAVKSNLVEVTFFNRWINSIYYVTACLMFLQIFFPSSVVSFLITTATISFIQQIEILGSEEKTEILLKALLSD